MTKPLRVADLPAVASPCSDVCRIDAVSGWCEGCMRTLDEIALWGSLDDDDKRAVWRQLPLRRAERAGASVAGASVEVASGTATSRAPNAGDVPFGPTP